MAISRMQQPRQMYGLGSLVKKAVKGVTGAVKSIAKSDLGKAAILGIGAFGLPGGALGMKGFMPQNLRSLSGIGSAIFGGGALPPSQGLGQSKGLFGMAKNFLGGEKTLGKTAAMFGLGGLGAAALEAAGLDPDNPNEMPRDIESLKGYLRSGYLKLNPGARPEDVDAFVEANTREYAANGGRIGYADGTSFQRKALEKKGYSDTMQNMTPKEISQLYDSVMGTFSRRFQAYGGRIGYNEGTDFQKWLEGKQKFEQGQNAEQLYKEYLEDKRRQKIAEQKTMAANGGRIGYAFGDVVDQASGIMGLPQRVNQAGVKELDLRDSGGFIPPVGVKEKADDIPAMLSNNEFVFTAESVRNMGNGDVNKGAQRMYDMMKYLEKGGRV
jgi:hypothetical protein